MSNRTNDPPELLVTGPPQADSTVVLAHGAGAAMDSDFMKAVAESLADRGVRVVRFDFPYMAERRKTGKRRPPDREPVLRATWLQVIGSLKTGNSFIGGKSLGGRIASLIADDVGAAGALSLNRSRTRNKLFGTKPVSIFDPNDRSNEAVKDPLDEAGTNALRYWPRSYWSCNS